MDDSFDDFKTPTGSPVKENPSGKCSRLFLLNSEILFKLVELANRYENK